MYDDPQNPDEYQVDPTRRSPSAPALPNQAGPAPPVPPPHIQNDYWAPDREQVLKDPSRWGSAPGAAPAAPAPPPGQFNRDQFRDDLMRTVRTTGDLSSFVNQHQGDYGAGVKLLPGGKGDKIVLPDSSVIDAVMGAGINGGQGSAWTGAGTMGANGQITPQAAAPGAGGGNVAGGGGSDFQNQIRAQLLQILQRSQQPVDAADPQIAKEMTAQRALADRMAQQQRASAAERAAFNGLNSGGAGSGGFETELRGIQEDEGQQLQGLQASLFGRVAQQKQAQLQQALQLAVQSGDAESARAIQMQIAQMDNQIRQQQLGQQQSQWNDRYGLDVNDQTYRRSQDAKREKAGLPF